ncbi:MAG: sugar phosphate nucleotidyltransferase [Alphaproteobacteria bacterium]|nr:sugar phosphate nucleotidyltransferase [Alphaproteobacteria bacterium]
MTRVSALDYLVCRPEITIREALNRLNNDHSHIFQIVVDSDRRVIGTVTDGDVRRAMLREVTLDDSVDKCMNGAPIVGRPGDTAANRDKLRGAEFLPIVDAEGRIQQVLIQARAPLASRALIMAGGFGKRLGARTRDVPKPLLTVGDRPILDRVLTQLEDGGVEAITIAVHYRAEQVEAFVAARGNRAEINFIREPEPLGTVGALTLMPDAADETTIIVNGDVVSRVDFAHLHNFHAEHDYDGTVAVSRYNVHIPFGVLRLGEDGLFSGIEEKPTNSYFVAAGIYMLSPEFVALTPSGRAVDMPELLEAGRRAGLRVGLFPLHEYWRDVGQLDDLAQANAENGA